jgi:hypothetical protein
MNDPATPPTTSEDEYETIKVIFSVTTAIPKNIAGGSKWTKEQKEDVARYLATYSTRCVGEFQKFDWHCGAFMSEAFQDPDNPEVIRARVTAIDQHLKFSSDDYTKEQFIEVFGQQIFNNLKKGWPRKHASGLHQHLIDFDAVDLGSVTSPDLALNEEPKIIEL